MSVVQQPRIQRTGHLGASSGARTSSAAILVCPGSIGLAVYEPKAATPSETVVADALPRHDDAASHMWVVHRTPRVLA